MVLVIVRILVVKHLGDSQSKVCPKQMDKDCVSRVDSTEDLPANDLVSDKDDDLDEGHDDELERGRGSDDGAKGDEHGRRGKVAVQHAEREKDERMGIKKNI
jgi:hypothetical protein